jgi:hypothetical protein
MGPKIRVGLALTAFVVLGVAQKGRWSVVVDLESDDPHKRRAAVESIIKHRNVPHDKIKAIADEYIAKKSKGGTVRDALRLLGKLQAREQIPYLVSLLPYRVYEDDADRPPSIETTFPAAGALIDIGLPAIKPVLERLRHETDEEALLAGAGVLRGILGRKGALKRVDEEMKNASPEEVKSLTQVSDLIKNHFMLQ